MRGLNGLLAVGVVLVAGCTVSEGGADGGPDGGESSSSGVLASSSSSSGTQATSSSSGATSGVVTSGPAPSSSATASSSAASSGVASSGLASGSSASLAASASGGASSAAVTSSSAAPASSSGGVSGVVIHEFLVDSTGSPDRDAFVELYGPPGLALTGMELVGLNGNGGTAYGRVALTGVLDANGYYVVAHPMAAAGILAVAAQTSTLVDYQNGPDTVTLQHNGVVLDAVGYGTFATSDVFAGEGAAVPTAPTGQSLGRNAAHVDTNNNAADFLPRAPTPGAANEVVSNTLAAILVCPTTLVEATDGTFNASGSTGAPVSYRFNWGDGTPATVGPNAVRSHAFFPAGMYTVTLTVTDAQAATATASCVVNVTFMPPPGLSAVLECPAAGFVGAGVTCSAVNTMHDNPLVRVAFDFGDGTAPVTGTQQTALHIYPQIGVFTVTLTVEDSLGGVDEANASLVITNPCGNGTVEGAEECDDNNTTPGDGCSPACVRECLPGGQPTPEALGAYTRVCPNIMWTEALGTTTREYTFSRAQPFRLNLNLHDGGGNFCPTATMVGAGCNSTLLTGYATVLRGGTQVVTSNETCGQMFPASNTALHNLPAGDYMVRFRTSSYNCGGNAPSTLDFNFSPPQ